MGLLRLWTPVVLVPMAGVADVPSRRLCRIMGESGLPDHLRPVGVPSWTAESGEGATTPSPKAPGENSNEPCHVIIPCVDAPAGLYVTEMMTSRTLVKESERTLEMVRPDPAERARSLQLYGVNPAVMAEAATMLVERDLTNHIDLNFGCPVPRATKKGGGAALPWKRDLFSDLVGTMVCACDEARERAGRETPVTVKIRISTNSEHETVTDTILNAQKLDAAAPTLHTRIQNQHYAGHAHRDEITHLRDLLDIPVFGSGDVFEAADALAMLGQTGCDGISVGRDAQGRPWIFRDIVVAYHGGPIPPGPSLAEVVSVIECHAAWCVVDQDDEGRALREMRKHIGWYLRGFAVGGPQRRALSMVSTLRELHERLADLDLNQAFPPAARGPRGRAGGEKTPHLPDGWLDHPSLAQSERDRLHLAEIGY